MVDVAAGGEDGKGGGETLPMVFKVPHFHSDEVSLALTYLVLHFSFVIKEFHTVNYLGKEFCPILVARNLNLYLN